MVLRVGSLVLASSLLVAASMTDVAARQSPAQRVIRVNALGVERTLLASTVPQRRDRRPLIAKLAADGQHIVAMTQASAFWFDGEGQLVRQLSFPRRLRRVDMVTLQPGEAPVFVGETDDYGQKLLLVPSTGGPARPLRLDGVRAAFADVLGDARKEVVVRARDTLLIYTTDGHLLRRVRAGDYVWHFDVLDANGSPPPEFVTYLYQSPEEGAFIEILDVDGERVRAWHEPKSFRYTVSAWSSPEPALLQVLDGVITERTPRGTIIRQFRVPGLDSHRRPQTGLLADGNLLLLVWDGSQSGRLVVFAPDGTVLYDESSGDYWWLLVPTSPAREFYVGGDTRIWRFRLPPAGNDHEHGMLGATAAGEPGPRPRRP